MVIYTLVTSKENCLCVYDSILWRSQRFRGAEATRKKKKKEGVTVVVTVDLESPQMFFFFCIMTNTEK